MNEKWQIVGTFNIKYESYTLTEFMNMVKEVVPKGTKDEDVLLDFEADESSVGYYDDYVIESTLTVSIRK